MFLSRVEMDWVSVRNPYEIHRKLWRMFPGQERETRCTQDENRLGFLFRLESYTTGTPVRVLVQSGIAPISSEGVHLIGTRHIHPEPITHQRLAFILTANPVKRVYHDAAIDSTSRIHTRNTCRVPLIREDDQQQWLIRKLAGSATLEYANIMPSNPLFFRKKGMAGKVVPYTFEGVLRVENPSSLMHLLVNGVGPAKGFGCGLMMVRRLA